MRPWQARRSPRLAGFDYSQPGLYFVTVCTWAREPLLGHIVASEVQLSQAGRAALEAWAALPLRFPAVDLDAFVFMPNHIHGILVLGGDSDLSPDVARPNLAAVMRTFKSVSGIQGNRALERTNQPFWQRSYHDRIVRNARDLTLIRQYVAENPARWKSDVDNPSPTDPTRPPTTESLQNATMF
jgi:REP element-mobilizing transposase RayT